MTHFLKICKQLASVACISVASLMLASPAAATITLTPTTAGVTGANLGPANCEPGCVETQFGVTDLTLFYKADVGNVSAPATVESGTFASSYSTVFNNTALDPMDALISYTGGAFIACPSCYLAIKDGNQNPSYYFYDLGNWNGTESISMTGFWPNKGAISHVSIWGKSSDVPEPGTLALVALALLGAGFIRRRNS